MTVLGAFEAIRPADEDGKVSPALPGDAAVSILATIDRAHTAKVRVPLAEMIRADAERSLDRALRRVDSTRTSTTLAALAQTHAALGQTEAAVAAAHDLMREVAPFRISKIQTDRLLAIVERVIKAAAIDP